MQARTVKVESGCCRLESPCENSERIVRLLQNVASASSSVKALEAVRQGPGALRNVSVECRKK